MLGGFAVVTMRLLLAAMLTLIFSDALAFKLSPEGTAEERKLTGIERSWIRTAEVMGTNLYLEHFNEPVHEEITNRIYGCEGGSDLCGGMRSSRAPAAVLAGVRWNDDPPFRLVPKDRKIGCKNETIRFQTQPSCWLRLFLDAKKRAARGDDLGAKSGAVLLYRTHFGDLQYLHAMGASNGASPRETRDNILGWAEFTWRVALGEIEIGTLLNTIEIPAIQAGFGRTGWSIQDLWTLGSPGLRREIQDVAFGSLLHLVQDSFAEGHVDREQSDPARNCSISGKTTEAPGRIREFHSYVQQDGGLHAEADSAKAFMHHLQQDVDVVSVGEILLDAYEDKIPWSGVEPFFQCIFELAPAATPSSPGQFFEKT